MICMQKNNSPYTSLTGCTFLYYEFKRILPVLMSGDAERLLKEEVENNQILQVNSRTSRQRFAHNTPTILITNLLAELSTH